MLSLKERIELLERDLCANPPAFIMTADLPFALFRYDPSTPGEGEWLMRREIQNLKTRVENATTRRVHIISLAELFWKSIEESEGIHAVIQLEREQGFRVAERQIHTYLTDDECWRRSLPALLQEAGRDLDPRRHYLFLTRASVFAPSAYRVSALLEQMKGRLAVPTVLFYPGTWTDSLNYMGLRSEDALPGSYRVKIYGRES